ncbi:MAG TPA: serine hydrolase domain-containing protein [Caulobacteraceae bacterium]|jgi:CubicO group peptidase (beta-lactamase class C family)
MKATTAACLVLAASALGAVSASAGPINERRLSACLAADARAMGFSGIVSVVLPSGPVAYANGRVAGPNSPKIDENSRFNLASAGKMFTAAAIGQLVDGGRIGLDDPVGGHVKGLSRALSAVTVRQLLDHRAGLGNYFTPANLPAISRARSAVDLLPLIAGETPAFAPDSRFAYSNSGFLLLGILIERVSGLRYGDYLAAHVFGPAGMGSSSLDPRPDSIRAVGMTAMPVLAHALSGTPPPAGGALWPAPEAALWGGPAGGAYSTAADLRRFFTALEAGRLLSPAMYRTLTSPSTQGAYGLGFGTGVFHGHRWFGHNGGAPGVNTELAAFPDDNALVFVLADRDPPMATALYRQVRETIFNPAPCGAP